MNLLHVLTKGLVGRIIFIVVMLFIITLKIFILPDTLKSDIFVGIVIVLLSLGVYLKTSFHFVILMHSLHAKLTPGFFPKLKQALFTLVALSLLPALLLLPNIEALLILWSWQFATLLVIMLCYKFRSLYWAIIIVMIGNGFIASFINNYNIRFPEELMKSLMSQGMLYCLPVWLMLFIFFTLRIEKHLLPTARFAKLKQVYQGDIFHVNKRHMLSSSNENKPVSTWRQNNWLQNLMNPPHQLAKNIAAKLYRSQPLAKTQLIAIATGGINYLNFRSMLTAFFMAAMFFAIIYTNFLNIESEFSMGLILAFGCGGALASSMAQFMVSFNQNKGYLARLRLTPLFENEQRFNKAVLRCYLFQQGRMFAFSLFILFSYLQLFTTVAPSLYVQVLGANLLSFFSVTCILIWGLQRSKLSNVVQIFGATIIGLTIGLYTLMQYSGYYQLSTQTLIIVVAIIFSITVFSLLNWSKKGVNWRTT